MAAPTINQGLQPDFTAQYSSTLELLLQQETSVLRPFVTTQGGLIGKMASPVTQYASVTMKAPRGRFSPLDHVQPTSIRPRMFPQPGELTELIDNFDQLQTIVDPTTGYVRVASAATARYWDDGIITSATGSRQIGTDIANLTTQTFLTTNFGSPRPSVRPRRRASPSPRSSKPGASCAITTTTSKPIRPPS